MSHEEPLPTSLSFIRIVDSLGFSFFHYSTKYLILVYWISSILALKSSSQKNNLPISLHVFGYLQTNQIETRLYSLIIICLKRYYCSKGTKINADSFPSISYYYFIVFWRCDLHIRHTY